jgi:hypothetical protein
MGANALRALADAADALARMARAAAEDGDGGPDSLIPIREAARIAATSIRVLRDAIRMGDLTAYGRSRDRAVRRADLQAWVASRRVEAVPGVDDADVARRIRRLERRRIG